MQLDIGGCPVMCINSKKRFVVAVDANVVNFISKWLVPLATESARLLAKESPRKLSDGSEVGSQPKPRASTTQEDSQTSDASSAFAFAQQMVRNIKDKVY